MLSRRRLLQAASTLPLLSAMPAFAADVRLRMFWWGGQERAKRTIAVNDLYHRRHPDVTIAGESQDGAAYFQKLATELAGRDAPDIFQLEPTALPDFARRGATLPLDPMLGKEIATKDFAPGMLDLCAVDGKVQGLPIGVNSFSLFVDDAAFTTAGFAAPTDATTWDQYAELCVAFTKKVNKPQYWASPDGSRYHDMFRVWLGQRGKVLFTAEGKLGCTADDAAEWFDYWDKLRKAGGITPADVASLDSMLVSTYPMTLGKSPICIAWSNQLVAVQDLVKPKLSLAMYPSAGPGKPSGHYFRAALIWSLYKLGKNPNPSADVVNFFLNDPDAAKLLGVERGVPPSLKMREVIAPTLNPAEQATVAFVDGLAGHVIPPPPPAPRGANEFNERIMRTIADEVAFGRLSPSAAGKRLISDTQAVI